jgi:SAM-dependent methyltransferase
MVVSASSVQSLRDRAIAAAKRYLPASIRRGVVGVQRALRLQWPPAGTVRFGSLRRVTPISPIFGFDRGLPIDRYYIERFLDRYRADIRGRALEFGDTVYLDAFGDDRIRQKDVFSYVSSPTATVVGDLTGPIALASDTFDCIVCTQTVQMIYDIRLAIKRLHAMLKPGGVLLLTSNGLVKTGRHLDSDGWGEYWHITQEAARSLFAENFEGEYAVGAYGNVLSAICFLHGLASSELMPQELDYADRNYDVVVTVRAVKAAMPPALSRSEPSAER